MFFLETDEFFKSPEAATGGFLYKKPATLLKRDSNTGLSCEYCQIFKNTYFEEQLRATALTASDFLTLFRMGVKMSPLPVFPLQLLQT